MSLLVARLLEWGAFGGALSTYPWGSGVLRVGKVEGNEYAEVQPFLVVFPEVDSLDESQIDSCLTSANASTGSSWCCFYSY